MRSGRGVDHSIGRSVLLGAAIVAAAFALGVLGIGRSLWLDEAWVANSIRAASLQEMFFYPDWLQTSPPLFLLLSRGVVQIFGLSDAAFRIVPLALALIGVAVTFAVAIRVLSLPWVGLAASIIAFHPAAIEFSHSSKQYSGELAATALVLFCGVRYFEGASSARPLLAAAVIGQCLAYPIAF